MAKKAEMDIIKLLRNNRRRSLIFTILFSLFLVFSAAVSTFAWFQATSAASIEADSNEASVTVQAPTDVEFYYFTGNGTPGGDYTGYSRADSAIGKAPRTYTYNPSSPVEGVSFSDFQKITGEGIYTASNCFNLSKIRPGCYYTYCVKYAGSSVGLKVSLTNYRTGNNTTPKRKIGTSGSSYFASVGLALNGAVSAPQPSTYAATFIKDAFAVGNAKNDSTDKIQYPTSDPAGASVFTFTSGQNTTTNNYIFFSIFMGFNNKADALLYNSKSGTGASEILYYTRDNSYGDYSALYSLSMSVNSIEVTLS